MLYPILNEIRSKYSLDGIWNFKQGDYKPGVDEPLSSDELMVVPSSFNDISVAQEKRNYIGDNWYERTFIIPKYSSEQEAVLRFGSVTHQAKVFVNGQLLGEHIGGFTPFEVTIPRNLTDKNHLLISVCANNELNYSTLPVGNYIEEKLEDGSIVKKVRENFDFFNYAGIQRPVQLLILPKKRIEDIEITYQVNDDSADVFVNVQHISENGSVEVSILDEDGKVVAESKENGQLKIQQLRRWEVLDSYLYTAKVSLVENGHLIDEYEEPFGVRTIEVKDGKFLINNKSVYFKGFGKHEDSFVNGRGFSAALDMSPGEKKVVKTWEVMNTTENHKLALKELIQRDKNYACVVLWSIANEPDGAGEGADKYFEPLVKYVKELDPQGRPTTVVNIMMATPEKDLVSDYIDVLCLNRYYGWYLYHGEIEKARKGLRTELLEWQSKYPEKPIIMTEYGADTLPGYHSNWDIPYTEEYQERFHEMSHEVFDEIPHFVGEHVWNFADFETNTGLIRIQGNHKGLYSRSREPKSIVKLFKKRWQEIPNYGYKK